VTGGDVEYFKRCMDLGLVKSPFLEVGSAKVQGDGPNFCDLAATLGIEEVLGVDLEPGKGVDHTADFSIHPTSFAQMWDRGKFGTVAIFNVLEHTFDPITVLKNSLHCVSGTGTLIALTPVVWPIHNYPRDYNRLLPDWYKHFACANELRMHEDAFCWISQFGIIQVSDLKDGDLYLLPTSQSLGRKFSPWRYWKSRVIHRAFKTFGRSHWFTHAAIGAAFGH
jgi:hypothetical protein